MTFIAFMASKFSTMAIHLLGIEQLTASNVCFWRDYYIQTARHGEALFLNNTLNTYKLALADDIANTTDHCLQYRSLADYDAFISLF